MTQGNRRTPIEYVEWDGDCWAWVGSMYPNGYGCYRTSRTTSQVAHRAVWEQLVGPIPDGLVLDHLCRNTRCVNPDHLEPVANAENLRRGAITWAQVQRTGNCAAGHALAGDNVYVTNTGRRRCLTCMRAMRAERYRKWKQANDIPDARRKGTCEQADCDRPHEAKGLCKYHYNAQWFRARREVPA